MRMAGPDVVLFVVGALLFGGATYAIVSSDGAGGSASSLGVFDVTFQEAEVQLGEENVGSVRSATAEFTVQRADVARITVTVTCADPASAAAPFQLQVRAQGPSGLTGEGTGACGQGVTIDIPVSEMPPALSVRGATEAEARENLAPLEGAARASGAWTVTVSGARTAGGTPLPVPAGDPAGTIALSATVWEPRFVPVQR